jgi:Cof subfamily protein (haloacid dehalogenase superfamily)
MAHYVNRHAAGILGKYLTVLGREYKIIIYMRENKCFVKKEVKHMKRKWIFFDIDGTLIAFGGLLPESTQKALRMVQENGHRIFICTGRSHCQIDSRLLEMGFDGIVAAAGAYVEYQGRILQQASMTEASRKRLVMFMEQNRLGYMIQCADKIVSTSRCNEQMRKMFQQRNEMPIEQLEKVLANQILDDNILEHISNYPNMEKVTFHSSPISLEEIKKALAPEFDVTSSSLEAEGNTGGEITMAGITKASGMQRIMDLCEVNREDVIAFGDGPNDFEMLEFAGIGVAMGNGLEKLKQQADMVTKPIHEDGIYYGLQQLGLL